MTFHHNNKEEWKVSKTCQIDGNILAQKTSEDTNVEEIRENYKREILCTVQLFNDLFYGEDLPFKRLKI